ncbi:rolling circle replication-associated protein [Solibacillus sp. FSL K6-1523]|uniref:rolling circle replication-associated protein n=1 Tax=Solibacillus sp. FSL K6-1523 TaxID=2921471 RepID=UPI0030F7CF6B
MKLPKYNVENYEDYFVIDESNFTDSVEERIEKLRDKQVSKYRVKTIRSGPMLECEIYPIQICSPGGKRSQKKKVIRQAQSNLNDKNAKKQLIRLVNTNFTKRDIWITLTYKDGRLPADLEQAKKDMQNYIRRLKRHIKKYDLPELKYVYVTEYQDADNKKEKRVHHHMICNFADRDIAEELWNGGGRTQTRRLQPDDFGLEGLARYIAKEKSESTIKRYTPSRNLQQPKITIADSKVTRRRAEKIATEENMAQEIFEKLYAGYSFKDMEVKYSNYVAGAYIYVRMKHIEPIKQRRGTKQDE